MIAVSRLDTFKIQSCRIEKKQFSPYRLGVSFKFNNLNHPFLLSCSSMELLSRVEQHPWLVSVDSIHGRFYVHESVQKDLPSNYNNARSPISIGSCEPKRSLTFPLLAETHVVKMKTAAVLALILASATAFNAPQFATRAVSKKPAKAAASTRVSTKK